MGTRARISGVRGRGRPKGSKTDHRARAGIALTQAQFDERVKLTDDQFDALDRIASGFPPRNAQAIIRAIEAKLSYGYSKPKQTIEHTGKLTLEQIMLEALKPEPEGGEGTS